MDGLSPRFTKGYEAIGALSADSRYQAAFIFGSVAEGTSTAKSDLDVMVVVDEDNPCQNINHPTIDDYKLDITFRSFKQVEVFIQNDTTKGVREPYLMRGVIVFDKTGELTDLQQKVWHIKAQPYTERDYQHLQFMLYHANNKVERSLGDDPVASLYSMHANIGELLKIHYKLNGKWWVSSKNILNNLEMWDKDLALLVKNFVTAAEVKEKYWYWSAIMDHITSTMGGRQPIAENNCDCGVCVADLAALEGFKGE